MRDPPSDDLNLQSAIAEIEEVLARRHLAGAIGLVSDGAVGFYYRYHAPWSAIRPDLGAPLGIRISANEDELGPEAMRARLTGAVHTLMQLRDFGERTSVWSGQLLGVMRDAGVEFVDVPHNGAPIMPISGVEED